MHTPAHAPAPDTVAGRKITVPLAHQNGHEGRTLLPGAEPFIFRAGDVGCLMVHGFTSSPFEMRGLGRYLAERGITAAAPLLAGHGTDPEDLDGKTWHDWYGTVTDALDDLRSRCRRVYLAGLSLGGALALYTAAQRGQDLAGIVAMSAPIYLPPSLGPALRGINRAMPYLQKPYSDIEDPEARARHVGYTRSSVSALASLVEFLGPVRAALPRVKVPTLVIYARHDHVVPCVSSHYIYTRLGTHHKRMVALHRGYHIATMDLDREKVYAAIHGFISEREVGRKV